MTRTTASGGDGDEGNRHTDDVLVDSDTQGVKAGTVDDSMGLPLGADPSLTDTTGTDTSMGVAPSMGAAFSKGAVPSATTDYGHVEYQIHNTHEAEGGGVRTGSYVRAFVQKMIQNAVNLSTLIGSGMSFDAIPLMSGIYSSYVDELKKRPDNAYSQFSDMVTRCENHIGVRVSNGDLETLLTWLDGLERVGAQKARWRKFHSGLLLHYRQCVASFADAGKEAADKTVLGHYAEIFQGLGQTRQILQQRAHTLFDVVNLFTTNQDLYHERALERNDYPYTDGFASGLWPEFKPIEFHRRPVDLEERFRERLNPITPYFKLVKLHGSLNWLATDGPAGTTKVVKAPFYTDRRVVKMRDASGSPIGDENVVVAPTNSKYALTQDLPYVDLFHEFVNALSVPNTVLFSMGFSFGDAHIARIVENALRRSDFILVAFFGSDAVDGDNPSHAFMERNKQPNAYYITPNKPPCTPSDKSIPVTLEEIAHFMRPSLPEPEDNSDA